MSFNLGNFSAAHTLAFFIHWDALIALTPDWDALITLASKPHTERKMLSKVA